MMCMWFNVLVRIDVGVIITMHVPDMGQVVNRSNTRVGGRSWVVGGGVSSG